MSIKILIANPAALHVTTGTEDWIVAGSAPQQIADELPETDSFADAVERATSCGGECTIVRVDPSSDTPVCAFRSITSSFDLFYCRREDGTMLVGDHFRDVLSQLPVAERRVPAAVPVDQLLLGTRPTQTYVEAIDRLGHGERLDWAADGTPTTRLVETIQVGERIDPSTAIQRLDSLLRDSVDRRSLGDNAVTMLSGGVDSTLLHTYAATERSVSWAVDSPEFNFEVEYAKEASTLLGSTHEMLAYDEQSYLSLLERAIDAAGIPLLLPQEVLMNQLFVDSPAQTYINGYLADGIFGTGTAALAYLGAHLGPATQVLPAVSWELSALKETTAQIRRPATALDGAAMNFRIHADQERVASIFGQDAVDERKHERLDYTRRRIPVDEQSGYGPHMHLGHAIEFYHDVVLTNLRQLAHANGNQVVAPFAGREVFETVLALSPADRYARFSRPPLSDPTQVVEYKYILKDLLSERLPAYDTTRPKGHGLLPFSRYLDDGPLDTVFEKYPLPEFIPSEHRESVRTGTEEVTWYAANYAIWRDRILENDALEPFETTTVLDFGPRIHSR